MRFLAGRQSHHLISFMDDTGSEGEIRNVWDLMEDYYSDTKDNSKVKNFLRNMSVFTRWYSYETGINNRFGDYEVSRN